MHTQIYAHIVCILHSHTVFRDGLTGMVGNEELQTDVHMDRKLGLHGLRSVMEKLLHPRNSMWCYGLHREVEFLHTDEQGGRVITFKN